MKNRIIVFASAFVILFSVFGFTLKSENEPCTAYIPFKEGITMHYTNFNAKDKIESSSEMTLKSIKETAAEVAFDIHSKIKDKKGEVVFEEDFEYTCKDGVFHVSMDAMMQKITSAYEGMDVEMTNTDLLIPGNLSAGQELKDAEMNMKVSTNGMQIMTMKIKIVERKVEMIETIETTAGSFKCAKITSKTEMDMGFMKKVSYTTDWYAEDIGMIRSESYNDKKKLESYTLLTKMDN